MPKTTTALQTPLREQLDRLAALEPSTSPMLSVYLDLRADQHGRRASTDVFLRKAFAERSKSLEGDARKSFDAVAERIRAYLQSEVPVSVTAVAIFASVDADGFFEALQLDTPIEHNGLFVGPVPHLYPLARLNDQYPRYAALVFDTNSARLFVFSLGRVESQQHVANPKTRGSAVGGWSQTRYQRHIENAHMHHMKEVAAVLDRVLREEQIDKIVLACDEVARPALLEQLPGHLAAKIVDTVALDINAPEHEVLAETLDVLRQHDGATDVERVQAMLDEWAAGSLGVVGVEATLDALAKQQVEELLLTARADDLRAPDPVHLSGQLVAMAQQNSARIRFIEDATLLADVGGVGALLRFRINPHEQTEQSE